MCQTGSARNHPWEVSVLFLPLSGCNCVLTNIDRVLRFCAISPLCSVRRLAIVTHPVMPLTDLWFETPASVRDDSVLRAASAAVLHVARRPRRLDTDGAGQRGCHTSTPSPPFQPALADRQTRPAGLTRVASDLFPAADPSTGLLRPARSRPAVDYSGALSDHDGAGAVCDRDISA